MKTASFLLVTRIKDDIKKCVTAGCICMCPQPLQFSDGRRLGKEFGK